MIVYALIDPRDGAVRYIGKTHRSAHRRLRRHLAPIRYVQSGRNWKPVTA